MFSMFSIRNIKFACVEHAHNARLLAKTKYFKIRFMGSNITLLAGKVLSSKEKEDIKKLNFFHQARLKNNIYPTKFHSIKIS